MTEGRVIALESVVKTYVSGPAWARRYVDAVRSLDLSIEDRETLGLVGESGSGKTTVGRLCLGLLRPTSGRVLFEGRPYHQQGRRLRGRLAAVLQHPQWSLNPRLRVGSSVAEPLVINRSGTRRERQHRVSEMLELVGLDESLAQRFPHELSGGQRQRVSIARALITTPRLIVFDEAVSALDVSVQAQILNLVKELQAEVGFSALFISHNLGAVRYVAHRIAVMYRGEILEIGPSARFYEEPAHPYTRLLQRASHLSRPVRALRRETEDTASSGFVPLDRPLP